MKDLKNSERWLVARIKNDLVCFHIIDNSRRDLEWRLKLSDQLAKNGVISHLGDAQYIEECIVKNYNFILCGRLGSTSSRSPFDKYLLEKIIKHNGKIIFFHDEGAIFSRNDYERFVQHTYPADLFHLDVFEKVFFWGEKQSNYFKSEPWYYKSSVIGMPRLGSPFSKNKINEGERYILINSRFGDVNKPAGDVPFFSKRKLDIRKESDFLTSPQILQYNLIKEWSNSAVDFAYFVEMIGYCALSLPSQKFIIRPHPSEDPSFYTEAFSMFDNVKICKDGDVASVISSSMFIIHSQCSTAIEALVQDKLAINFMPSELTSKLAFVDSLGPIVKTKEELVFLIKDIINKDCFKFNKSNLDSSIIYNLHKPDYAINAIEDAVLDCFLNIKAISPSPYIALKNFFPSIKLSFRNKIRSVIKYSKYNYKNSRTYWPTRLYIKEFWIKNSFSSSLKLGIRSIKVKP